LDNIQKRKSHNNINGSMYKDKLAKGIEISKSVLIDNMISGTDGNTTEETTAPMSRLGDEMSPKVRSKISASHIMAKRIRPYVNAVGPGDYETLNTFGGSTNVATKRNSPSFSFAAGRDRTKAQFVSKEFL
jgi:hypothetical protein